MPGKQTRPLTAVLVGAGQRGHHVYGALALARGDLRFVAVVDPRPDRRDRFGDAHAIDGRLRFAGLDQLAASGVSADAWFVASPDRDHLAAARIAVGRNVPVFLEKPIAASAAEVLEVVELAERSGVLVQVAHVLRSTPFFQALNQTIASGVIGDVVTVDHRENVAAFHMAHSFVRGSWGRASEANPMIVAKCCHDFDVLVWNLPSAVTRLSSFGSLMHFRPEQAPEGATARCTDGCPVSDCPFDARRIYLNPDWTGWPVHVVTDDLSPEGRLRALGEGPYGRCVYTAGSDVVDHQVVAMQLEDGASVTLTMHGHSHEEGRTMRYDGTRGTIRAVFGREQVIEVVDHRGGRPRLVPIPPAESGHGGGDAGAVAAFVRAVRGEEASPTTVRDALESHVLAFAAEEARVTGRVLEMGEYRARFG
jgi:predicted dehydrogenase